MDDRLLIYHHLPKSGGTSLLAVVRENHGDGALAELYAEVAELHSQSAAADRVPDEGEWYRDWYKALPDEDRRGIRCVASHTAQYLMPAIEDRPFEAFCLLRDPVGRVQELYEELRALGADGADAPRRGELEIDAGREICERRWDVADIYRELGGGNPRTSRLHEQFKGFFNGQARSIIGPWRDQAKLEYWAGIPDEGSLLRERALGLLERHYTVGVKEQLERSLERFAAAFGWERVGIPNLYAEAPASRGRPDAETRSLILAHNQIDAELHAHFSESVRRVRPSQLRRRVNASQREGIPVCVLGMARSGTSLTARILNLLGVELGPAEALMRPAENNNPAGFWEHEAIADLNEEILAALSETPPPYLQGWRWPPPLHEGWENDRRLDLLRDKAGSILRQSFAGSEIWGWKDPRNCLTLPFWQRLVPGLRYVICVRHPLDVAASLETRDGMSQEEAIQLWLRYMSVAVMHTSGRRRAFVSYEGYFPGWEEQAERLAGLLGVPGLSDAGREEIAGQVDQRLRHHREGERSGANDDQEAAFPREAAELYEALSALTGPEPNAAPDAWEQLDAVALQAWAATRA